jgi:hypothetical protein
MRLGVKHKFLAFLIVFGAVSGPFPGLCFKFEFLDYLVLWFVIMLVIPAFPMLEVSGGRGALFSRWFLLSAVHRKQCILVKSGTLNPIQF